MICHFNSHLLSNYFQDFILIIKACLIQNNQRKLTLYASSFQNKLIVLNKRLKIKMYHNAKDDSSKMQVYYNYGQLQPLLLTNYCLWGRVVRPLPLDGSTIMHRP